MIIPEAAQALARRIVLSAMYAQEIYTEKESVFKVNIVAEDNVDFVGSLYVHYNRKMPCVVCDWHPNLLVTIDGVA